MKNDDTHNSKLIIFTGAGASAALKLPTTPEFAKQLARQPQSEPSLLTVYRTNMSQTKGISEKEVPIDSEYIRDWLENMKVMAKSIEDLSPAMKRLIQPKAQAPSHVVSSVHSLLDWFDFQITNTYGQQFNARTAYKHYSPLLNILKQYDGNEAIPLFTTNYDLIFESMKDYKPDEWNIVTGMRQTGLGKLILDTKTFNKASQVRRLLVYKLHGSSDWWENPENGDIEQVQRGFQTPKDYKRSLIYPTRRKFGQTKEYPFLFFYQRLKAHLFHKGIHACIVIGYSFRDEPINEIFVESLKNGLKLIIIDRDMKQVVDEFLPYTNNIRIHNLEFGNWESKFDNINKFTQILNDELDNDSNVTKRTMR